MKIHVLGNKISKDTVMFLSRISPLIVPLFDEDDIDEEISSNIKVLLRYGSSANINAFNRIFREENGGKISRIYHINRPSAVANSADKIKMRKLFIENDVHIPHTIINDSSGNMNVTVEASNGMYKRKSNHRRGSDMDFIPAGMSVSLAPGEILIEKINIKDEFRVFVFKNKIMEVDIKIKKEQPSEEEIINIASRYEGDASKDARNYVNGWTFIPIRNIPEGVEDEAIKAINAVELDFGAVDLCVADNDDVYVFETNSAPSIKVARKGLLLINFILSDILSDMEKILDISDMRIGDLIRHVSIRI
jgi:hypothetical protein